MKDSITDQVQEQDFLFLYTVAQQNVDSLHGGPAGSCETDELGSQHKTGGERADRKSNARLTEHRIEEETVSGIDVLRQLGVLSYERFGFAVNQISWSVICASEKEHLQRAWAWPWLRPVRTEFCFSFQAWGRSGHDADVPVE
jgi:hypothetical protein